MAIAGTASTYVSILERDMIVTFDYEVTYKGCAAKLYGPPENCYPAESAEYNITNICLEFDGPVKDKHAPPVYLDVPKWLEEMLYEYLVDSDDVSVKIHEHIAEGEQEYDEDYYRDDR